MAAGGAEHEARRILEIAEGFMKSQVLFTGLKLGIFDLLDASADPMTAVSISEGIGADTDATKRLLDACTGLGFLRKLNADNETEDGKYQLTEASRMFLTTSSPTNLADWVGHLANLYGSPWADLPMAIREGPAFSTHRGLERGKTFKDIYSTTKGFMGAMEGLPTVFGAKTASAFNLTEFQNICDIGGCTGPLAYHLAAAYPKASISVFDLPEVVKVAVARGPDDEQGQRVSFLPGDFFHDPLPPADLYVVCRILHDWTEDKVLTILTKIHDSLPPGGGLLVVEHMLGDDKTGPEVAHKYDLLMMLCTGGRQRSGREFQRLLSSVGFQEVTIRRTTYPFGHVLARKQRV
ncbi:PREDICTED: acetylserotonin O-methyltransferase-like [Branchiostoma belcheri]|uniref:Acetylserotonin O-methyltransferase n=1 Tax=Branchiostoma belcheri TaxID=7741 RepID=A0A6P4ZS27_BRABE|nr:PREDICTED: acetylserotonin O-methyltransferase-like [Branchiostoma belcheri]